MVKTDLPPLTGSLPGAPTERGADESDDLMARLEHRLRLRNQRLIGKLQAWGELLDAVGWSVALDWGGGEFWLSAKATRDLQQSGKLPTTWQTLLAALDQFAPANVYQKNAGVLIWSSPARDASEPRCAVALTQRESEVLDWIRQGKTSVEIAMILGCAGRTVDKHLANIYRKMGANNRVSVILNPPATSN